MDNYCKDCSTSIIDLPNDCLCFIFDYLESSSDREAFGLTCKRWLQVQNLGRRSLQFQCSFTNIGIPSLSQSHITVGTLHLSRLLNRFQQLHFLSLSGCVDLPDSELSQLQHYGSKLQSLHLHCCFQISDCGFCVIASGCRSLTDISLYRCNITDTGLKALSESCLSLKDVDLSFCSLISDPGIRFLTQNCRELRAVRITNCGNVTGVGFKGCSEMLRYIEANNCKLEPEGIVGILSGGGLKYLNVSCLSWSINGDGLAAIGTGFGNKLRVFDFRCCRTIGDSSIIAISKGCPLLQEWILSLCHEIRTAGWEAIGMNCHNVEKLHVNRCRNLNDEGLQALRNGCRKLSILYVSFRKSRQVSSVAIEVFKCLRMGVVLKEEEVMSVAPDWAFQV